MAVHKLLENVLASLSTDHTLSSWTIFKENNGFVSLKIRYKEGTGALNCVTEDHFRRKSQRQVMRDRHRSQQWKASRRSNTDGGQHSDQTDTPLSVTAVKVCVTENNAEAPTVSTTTEARDVEPMPVCAMSPAVTRRQTRASRIQDSPEIARCDDTDNVASLNMSSVSALNADASPFISDTLSLEHDVMSDVTDPTTVASIQDLSDDMIDPDPSAIEHTQDAASSASSSSIRCDTSEWEPPPGWCWSLHEIK